MLGPTTTALTHLGQAAAGLRGLNLQAGEMALLKIYIQESTDWRDVPIVFITLPDCPHCHALEHIIVRSEATGDGGTSRKCVCKKCSQPFKIAVELPEIGKRDF